MAGGGASTVSSGRRRELNVDVNLVPFIDLLSMCICFLLITAVWVQVGSVHVKQSHGTEAPTATQRQYDLELRFTGPADVILAVKHGARAVKTFNIKTAAPELMAAKLDSEITGWLKSSGGSAKDLVASAMVTPKQGVSYGYLVSVLDVLRKNQIVNLGVVPVKD